jgi:acyl carrier protein
MEVPTAPANSEPPLTRQGLLDLPDSGRRRRLCGYLQCAVSDALPGVTETVESDQRLNDLALDSFQALTMKHRLENDLGIVVPMVDFLDDMTLDQLAGRLVSLLEQPEAGGLSRLSDDEWEEGRL